MQIELLSSCGEGDSRYVVAASRPFLAGRDRPLVAYLAAATVGYNWLDVAEQAYRDLADVALVDVETMTAAAIDAVLDRAAMLLVSGGNTFVLNERLGRAGFHEPLRRRMHDGLPVVAFSAGTNLCGANILTSNDMNACGTSRFDGLAIVRYSVNVHYPTDPARRAERDERLREYHAFHANPILALEDGAWLSVGPGEIRLRRGRYWVLERGRDARALEEIGAAIPS